MTRILLLGFGPMPVEKLRMSGPSLRTWHFVKVLLDAGHEICLIANRGQDVYPQDLPPVVSQRLGKWTYHSVTNDIWWDSTPTLKSLVSMWYPIDCVVGVTTPATAIGSRLAENFPLWGDLYGSIMAEAQTKSVVYKTDSYSSHFFKLEYDALRRADIFSAVSDRQRWSLIGELGLAGRLNQWTDGYDFVRTIPIANEVERYTTHSPLLRGTVVPEDAFIILYSGGYNTWCDVDTLFEALEIVWKLVPNAYFVSTGGALIGHDEKTYDHFKSLIEKSPRRAHYKLQGWIPVDDLPTYYLESDIAVNVDKFSYEAMLGSRTRVLDWMRAGLPCVLSNLPELAQELSEAGAGLAYTPGNFRHLAERMVYCAANPQKTAEMGKRARQLLLDKFTFQATADSLLEWANDPCHAPDFQRDVPTFFGASISGQEASSNWTRTTTAQKLARRGWPLLKSGLQRIGIDSRAQQGLAHWGKKLVGLQPGTYAAEYGDTTVPAQMRTDECYEITVTVTNKGSLAWQPAKYSLNGTNLSYHWLDQYGAIFIKEGIRTPLEELVVSRRQTVTTLTVQAPPEPGSYRLELDVLCEGLNWFSEIGSPGPQFEVEVEE